MTSKTSTQPSSYRDPKFPEEYQQPAIFDRAKESLLWHPDLAENPDIEEKEEATIKHKTPQGHSYVFTKDPRVRITRMQVNGKTTKYQKQIQTPATKISPQTRIVPKVVPSNTSIQRIIPIRASTSASTSTTKGPHQIRLPQTNQSTPAKDSIASRIKASTRRVLPAKLHKLLVHQAETTSGEQQIIKPDEENQTTQTQMGEQTPKPITQNEYKLTHVIGDDKCQHCEDNNKRLDYESRLAFPDPASDENTEEEDRRRGQPNRIRWHWTNEPIKPEGKDDEYVILKFTTKERFTKFKQSKATKQPDTPHSAPEVGDVRRFYEKTQKRYVTALIISAKGTPPSIDNLHLGLWNLHSQIQTIGAKKLYIQLPQKATRPLPETAILLAIEGQFRTADIELHIYFPEEREPF